MPKISAVMALYNTPLEYLKPTVESILSQSFSDFEFIIVDDASSMEFKAFFDSFNDARIKYTKLDKNSGPGRARNEGIKMAKGEYIAIVDSDDIYMPNRFEIQNNFLDTNQDISIISSAFKQSNNGKIPHVAEANDDIKILILFNSPLANPTIMFRRKVCIEKNVFYSETITFGEDYEFLIDGMLAGLKMANLKDVLMTYTRRKNQISKMKQDIQVASLKTLYKKILSNIGITPTDKELEIHHKIDIENFNELNPEEIINWYDKIIVANRLKNLFNQEKLTNKKLETLKKLENNNERLLKIKIGEHNLCLSKKLKIYLEKRS